MFVRVILIGLAVLVFAVTVLTLRIRATQAKMAETLDAIDHAVNGQPPGVPPLVDKVAQVITEQQRVRIEKREDDA